jgi:CubicO group peptidase (beta-lactamase class C family)
VGNLELLSLKGCFIWSEYENEIQETISTNNWSADRCIAIDCLRFHSTNSIPLPITSTQSPPDTPTNTPPDKPTDTPTGIPTDTPTDAPTYTPLPSSTPTSQPAAGISNLDINVEASIDSVFSDYIERLRLTGLEVGIVMHNEIVYAKGFGVRNSETQEPVTPESLFHMASVSKPFVATGIMQLVEDGKIDLDETVVTYLPYFKLDDERYKQNTIQQILSHVSGMPDVMDYHWDQPEYDDQALERYVRSLADQEMLFTPGDEFSYSNMAYEVMGDVIAKVSGQSFEEYMQENILTPLEMENSTFLKQEVPLELETTPHYGSGSPAAVYPYHRAHAPSSTLHSNVLEMSNWAIANMNRGTFNDRQILKESIYDLLWNPYIQLNEERSIGLGWFIGTLGDQYRIFHSGADVGFRSSFVMLPEESIAVIILANNERADPREMVEQVLEIILENEP